MSDCGHRIGYRHKLVAGCKTGLGTQASHQEQKAAILGALRKKGRADVFSSNASQRAILMGKQGIFEGGATLWA